MEREKNKTKKSETNARKKASKEFRNRKSFFFFSIFVRIRSNCDVMKAEETDDGRGTKDEKVGE